MGQCCGDERAGAPAGGTLAQSEALVWFSNMIDNCLGHAMAAKSAGRRIVGIMCEFTPRELILAADAVPVCLCGGSAKMIPPAEQDLPVNLCPLIKSTYGYHLTKSNPFIEMADLIVAETTCDGKKKMFELMGLSRPMYVLELPQKSDEMDAFEHWYRELRKFKLELERRFGVQITHEKLMDAIAVMNRERRLRRELAQLMRADDPPLTGRQLLELKSSISGIPADLEQYERLLQGLAARVEGPSTLTTDQRPPTISPANKSVRVLLTGVPVVHGAERVVDLIENAGGTIVCMENCTGLKPILEDVDEQSADLDPIRALAEKYFHLPCSVMTQNRRRLDVIRSLAAEYRPDCVIELVWQACITYDVESFHTRRLVERELGLPYLRIETDYSPSDSARISTRVEATFETVRQRAAEKGG